MSWQADEYRMCKKQEYSAPCASGNSGQADDPGICPEAEDFAPRVSGIPVQLHLHPMRPDEVSAAAAIERAVMGEPWSTEAFLEALENPCAVCLAAVWEQTGVQAVTPTARQTGMQAETLAARQGDLHREASAVRQGELHTDADGLFHSKSPLAGYCVLYHAADEGEIVTIAVREKWQRRGIADALLQTILRKADARGLESVWLEVRVSNVAAICLYKKQGFAVAGKRKNFYRAPREDALVMVRYSIRGKEKQHCKEERSSAC